MTTPAIRTISLQAAVDPIPDWGFGPAWEATVRRLLVDMSREHGTPVRWGGWVVSPYMPMDRVVVFLDGLAAGVSVIEWTMVNVPCAADDPRVAGLDAVPGAANRGGVPTCWIEDVEADAVRANDLPARGAGAVLAYDLMLAALLAINPDEDAEDGPSPQGLEALAALALAGDPEAQFQYGQHLGDDPSGRAWLEKARDQGHREATATLAG